MKKQEKKWAGQVKYLGIKALSLMVLLVVLASCNKDDLSGKPVGVKVDNKCVLRDVLTHSTWKFPVGGPHSIILLHTDGLIEMALSGNTGILHAEQCQLGTTDKKIPSGLGDDIHNIGYAPHQLVLGDYIVAMYHPKPSAHDHFITYNWRDGSWIHWKLSNFPRIIIQS